MIVGCCSIRYLEFVLNWLGSSEYTIVVAVEMHRKAARDQIVLPWIALLSTNHRCSYSIAYIVDVPEQRH